MMMPYWKTLALVALVGLGVVWYCFKSKTPSHDILITCANTADAVLIATEGRVSPPGSISVIAHNPVIIRVYLIEKGEQVLKETIRFDPKDVPAIYFTLSVTSQRGAALLIRDHPAIRREPIYRAITFPSPISMGHGIDTRTVATWMAHPGQEVLFCDFFLAWSERSPPGDGSIDDMKKWSIDRDCSYIILTCEPI